MSTGREEVSKDLVFKELCCILEKQSDRERDLPPAGSSPEPPPHLTLPQCMQQQDWARPSQESVSWLQGQMG